MCTHLLVAAGQKNVPMKVRKEGTNRDEPKFRSHVDADVLLFADARSVETAEERGNELENLCCSIAGEAGTLCHALPARVLRLAQTTRTKVQAWQPSWPGWNSVVSDGVLN